jgi:glycosyltransferase involved in cell wall biosynthesis
MSVIKVIHLTSVHPARDTRIFHKECRSLAEAGFEVVLIAGHEQDEVVNGIQIKAIVKPNRRLGRMTTGVWRIYQEALRQNGDLYHFHDPELIPVGLLLRRRGKRVIYDIHEDLPRDIYTKHYLPHWVRGPVSKVAEKLENASSRHFAALVPATPTIAERFRTLNPNNVVLRNYPVLQDRSTASVPLRERPLTIAYAGLISRERGILELITALGLLPDRLPVRLTLAGQFVTDSLLREASSLPGWRRVDYVGFVNPETVPSLLANCRAGMVVLRPEPSFIDSLPTKLFEYMAAGIPVIASDFPMWRRIVEASQCGVLVNPLDPREISRSVEYLMSHSDACETMGLRGRAALEKQYNWNCEREKLFSLYRKLTGSEKTVDAPEYISANG